MPNDPAASKTTGRYPENTPAAAAYWREVAAGRVPVMTALWGVLAAWVAGALTIVLFRG
jgi:hypothetical protein